MRMSVTAWLVLPHSVHCYRWVMQQKSAQRSVFLTFFTPMKNLWIIYKIRNL